MKKTDSNVSISPFYQKWFIVAAISVWLVQLVFVALETVGHNSIPITTIWLYQLSAWGMPALFFVVALLFLRGQYKRWTLLFWATFLAVAGDMVYVGLQSIEQGAYQLYVEHQTVPPSNSFWNGEASIWFAMVLGALLFVISLIYMHKRKS